MTLKQIITRLEQLAASHKQINHFFIGGFNEFLDDADVIYPALFCELKPTSTISLTDRVANFSFTFHFFDMMDIANRSLQNEWEVKSDMISVALDYISLLKDVDYKEWEVEDDYNLEIRDYELQDLTCGVSVDVTIGVRFNANKCQAVITPSEEVGNFLIWNDLDKYLINDTEKLIYGE